MINKYAYQKMSHKNLNEQLLLAASHGKLELLDYLLTSSDFKIPANINHYDSEHLNSLMYACIWGHLDIVKYLLTSDKLKNYIEVNNKDKGGINGLIWAARYEHLDIVNFLLIEMKINIDKDTLEHLTNNTNYDYSKTLKIIKNRDLYAKLNNNINCMNYNEKKMKI